MDVYKAPESELAGGAVNGMTAKQVEEIASRRKLMLNSFWAQIGLLVVAGIIFGVLGGDVGMTVAAVVYAVGAIAGVVCFVVMLMLTNSLHGGGWVAGNFILTMIVPLYVLFAIVVLNRNAKERLKAAGALA